MTDDVKAALTPDEWSALEYVREGKTSIRIDDKMARWGGALEVGNDEIETHSFHNGEARHALAALALHGQAFGFSWEDVRYLREIADDVEFHYRDDSGPTPVYRPNPDLAWLADRIAALLPPRDPNPADS
jgi:hypothetical protein